ncbi:MAG: cbb3-type cytochrome c oxidase subunit II [candidate division Zixibacteria bacterium]|nr:cbb3-type cytochrome c oxidase subunit II [candidate division Zixibacteria bacterium]
MSKDKFISTDRVLILIAGLLFFGITIMTIIKDASPDWKYYQSEFIEIAIDVVGIEKAEKIPQGIQQIWVEDLNRVDRCMTCHQGIFWPGFEREPQPYATHPNLEIFNNHLADDYGCTICHGGQGYAVDFISAHGFSEFWEEPLLASVVASDYNIGERNAMIEINCNVCHRYERETEGMPYINLAKDLIQEKACWGCHIINGSGGTIGPDLTNEGEKHGENFDWSNYTGFNTVFNWHFQHFDEPASIVPETVMPKMGLQTKDRQALTMLMMSWRDEKYPMQYIPGFKMEEQLHSEEIQRRDELLEGDGAFFIKQGCFGCHSVQAYDIKSPTEKGPDLTFAIDDVRVRFGQTLQEFIFDPSQSGTMSIIFSSKVILSDAEKWDLIDKLTKANREYKKNQQE